MLKIPRIRFHESLFANPKATPPPGAWQHYYGLRNLVLQALRPYGTVGEMGECDITDDEEGPPFSWPNEEDDPDFFVVDDWWNKQQSWVRVEAEPARLAKRAVFTSLLKVLREYPGWCVDIGDGKEQLLLFADCFACRGPRFRNAGIKILEDVLTVYRQNK